MKYEFLKISQNSQENTCVRVSFLMKLQVSACNFIKKETLAPVFSCEFCKMFNNTFITEHLRVTVSQGFVRIKCTKDRGVVETFRNNGAFCHYFRKTFFTILVMLPSGSKKKTNQPVRWFLENIIPYINVFSGNVFLAPKQKLFFFFFLLFFRMGESIVCKQTNTNLMMIAYKWSSVLSWV